MWPESTGSNGYGTYWTYDSEPDDLQIVLEHRITGNYTIGDVLYSSNGCASMYENKLEPDTVVFTESSQNSANKYVAGRNVEGGLRDEK